MTTEPVQRKLHYIFERYGIEPRKNFTFSFFSMGNEVFFVTDTKGTRLVLKNCLKNRSQELLEVETALMEHLSANGCPTAQVVPAKDGTKVVSQDGDWWIMTKHLGGHMPSWNTRLKNWHFRGAIEGLACYHRAARSFVPPHETGRIASWEHGRVLEWTTGLRDQLLADNSGRQSVEKMRTIIDRYVALAQAMPQILPQDLVDSCEVTTIHGDFHSFNIVYRLHRFAACYDFDFIRRDLRLWDISWTLRDTQRKFYFAKYGKKMWQDDFVPPEHEVEEIEYGAISWLVKHYTKIWPLPVHELALLPAMQCVLALYNLRFFDLANSESECLQHFGWYEWVLKRMSLRGRAFEAAISRLVGELGGSPLPSSLVLAGFDQGGAP